MTLLSRHLDYRPLNPGTIHSSVNAQRTSTLRSSFTNGAKHSRTQ